MFATIAMFLLILGGVGHHLFTKHLKSYEEYVLTNHKIAKLSEQPSCFVLPEGGDDAANKLSTYYDNGKEVTFLVESMDGLILCFVKDH
jgi:hypothetical protein